MTDEQRKNIRAARLILCPENKDRLRFWRESVREFRDTYFPKYSISTVNQLENSRTYKPSSRLQELIDKAIEAAEKKAAKEGK